MNPQTWPGAFSLAPFESSMQPYRFSLEEFRACLFVFSCSFVFFSSRAPPLAMKPDLHLYPLALPHQTSASPASTIKPKLDPVPRGRTVVDVFLTPIGCTFTAFVGPRHIVAGGRCHAAHPVIGHGRQKIAPRQVKSTPAGHPPVGRFDLCRTGHSLPNQHLHRRRINVASTCADWPY